MLTHAVIDALLGAIGAGDIGEHFPDTDERWRGADSLELLRHVDALLAERGAAVVNVDATVMIERPKLGSTTSRRCASSLADALGARRRARQREGDTRRGHGLRRPRRGRGRARGRDDRVCPAITA